MIKSTIIIGSLLAGFVVGLYTFTKVEAPTEEPIQVQTLGLSTYLTVQGGTGTSSPSGILYGDNGATSHLNTVTIGSGLTFSAGTLSATGGGGTYPFTPTSISGIVYSATSSPVAFVNELVSSSTIGRLTVGAFVATSTVTVPAGSIATAALVSNTISGVALGSNLNALTNDVTLSGSSYNGSAAISDWGIDLANANTWTGLITYNGGITGANATSTQTFYARNAYIASSTQGLLTAGALTATTSITLVGAATGCATFTTGVLSSTGVACGSGGGGIADPFTHTLPTNSATTSSIGIGTTTPLARLTVSATSSLDNQQLFSVVAEAISGATTTSLTVLSSGSVGIASTTPGGRLAVGTSTSIFLVEDNGVTHLANDRLVISGIGRITRIDNTSVTMGSSAFQMSVSGSDFSLQNNAGSTAGSGLSFQTGSGGGYTTNIKFTTGSVQRATIGPMGLGIGTTTPYGYLSISATSTGSTVPLVNIATSTASATSTAFIIDSNGKVGVSTSSPSSPYGLSVQGQIYSSGTSTFNGVKLLGLLNCSGGSTLETDASGNVVCGTDDNTGGGGAISKWATSTTPTNQIIPSAGVTTILGIGTTTSPYSIFSIQATSSLSNQNIFQVISEPTANATTTAFRVASNGTVTVPKLTWTNATGTIVTVSSSTVGLLTAGSINSTSTATSTIEGGLLLNTRGGNIGIGTTSPTQTSVAIESGNNLTGLLVTGSSNAAFQIFAQNRSAGSLASTDLVLGNNNASTTGVASIVNLGINSTGNSDTSFPITWANDAYLWSPSSGLIFMTGTSSPQGRISFATGFTRTSLATSSIRFTIDGSGRSGFGTTSPFAMLSVHAIGTLGTTPLFAVASSTSATSTVFIIDSNGNVGIGTTTPFRGVAISGNVITQNGQIANYIGSTTNSALLNGLYLVDWNMGNTVRFIATTTVGVVLNATSSNPIDGGRYILELCQDTGGSRAVTFVTPGQLRWPVDTGTTTVRQTANVCTSIGMIYEAAYGIYKVKASSTDMIR